MLAAVRGRASGLREIAGGVDQRDVRQRLREIAEHHAVDRIVFLGEQADVVAQPEQMGEALLRFAPAAHQRQRVGEPERAGQERAFAFGQAVGRGMLAVALDEAVLHELARDRLHRGDDARIARRQEADDRHQQQRGVELAGAVVLHERAARRVEAAGADVAVDRGAQRAPARHRAVEPVALRGAHRAVHRHPRHHLGVREMLRLAAHLPDAVVGLAPVAFDEVEQHALERPRIVVLREAGLAADIQRIDHLAVDVELELRSRGVADAHRRRARVTGQPWQHRLAEDALAGDAVQHGEVLRPPGRRPQQPLAPCAGLVAIAGEQQRIERERGVAQPAEPVVPVAHAADALGQRRRRRRHHAAGRRIGERLQHHQRVLDGVGVLPLVAALGAERAPGRDRRLECRLGVQRDGARLVRARIGEHERHALAGVHGEAPARREVDAVQLHRRAQLDGVGTAGRGERVAEAAHPRHHGAIAEADREIHRHRHRAAHTLDDAHDVGAAVAERHEVDQAHGAVGDVHLGFEHERVAAVAARDAQHAAARSDAKASVLRLADERSERGRRIEARHAAPVDRALAAHQRGRVRVADQRVVLDAGGPRRQDACAVGAPAGRHARASGSIHCVPGGSSASAAAGPKLARA